MAMKVKAGRFHSIRALWSRSRQNCPTNLIIYFSLHRELKCDVDYHGQLRGYHAANNALQQLF